MPHHRPRMVLHRWLSRCRPLLPPSWRLRRGRTDSAQTCWGGQMGNSAHCSPEIQRDFFTSDTYHSWFHPQVCIGDEVASLNRTPKILGVTLDTHFTFGPHARNCIVHATRVLSVMKTLAGSNWGFTIETLVATCKAIVRPILNYAPSIWFTQVSSSHLDKLEVIQNKAVWIANGCHIKAAVSHLRDETGVLLLRVHLELCSQQFYAIHLQPMHPSHLIVTSHPDSPLMTTLQASFHHILRGLRVSGEGPNASVDGTHPGSPIPGGPSAVLRPATLQVDFHSLPLKPSFPPGTSPLAAQRVQVTFHPPSLSFFIFSSHLWSGGRPPSVNQQQQ